MPVQHRHRIGKVTPVYVLTEYAASGVVGAVLCTADVIIVIPLTLKHRVADVGSRNADPCVYVGVYLLERRKVNGVLDRRCVYVGIDVLAGTALADPAPRVLGDDVAYYIPCAKSQHQECDRKQDRIQGLFAFFLIFHLSPQSAKNSTASLIAAMEFFASIKLLVYDELATAENRSTQCQHSGCNDPVDRTGVAGLRTGSGVIGIGIGISVIGAYYGIIRRKSNAAQREY